MILGVIPARGGSKGIPGKNIRPIAGMPLIAWTIKAAASSKLLDKFVVSTEDSEISTISRRYGAEVLARPNELATDDATTLSVLQHILTKIDAEIIVLLQCTSPVRREGLIDICIKKFVESKADSVATGYMCNLFEWGSYSGRRQDLSEFFHDDGNVYVIKADLIKRGVLWGEKMERVITRREENFEIDDEFDFWINEQILINQFVKERNK